MFNFLIVFYLFLSFYFLGLCFIAEWLGGFHVSPNHWDIGPFPSSCVGRRCVRTFFFSWYFLFLHEVACHFIYKEIVEVKEELSYFFLRLFFLLMFLLYLIFSRPATIFNISIVFVFILIFTFIRVFEFLLWLLIFT